MAIQIRRGPAAELMPGQLLAGEPVYTTDTKKLYIANGDGTTKQVVFVEDYAAGTGAANPNRVDHAVAADSLTTGATIDGMIQSSAISVAVAGSTQSTATTLTKDVNVITSGSGGIRLPAAVNGKTVTVINKLTVSIKIYPPTSGYIDTLEQNAALSMAGLSSMVFVATSASQWSTGGMGRNYASQPIGDVRPSLATIAPAGTLLLQGQLVSRMTYAALWAWVQAYATVVPEVTWSAGQKGAAAPEQYLTRSYIRALHRPDMLESMCRVRRHCL